jgi:hypothetical protein
MRDQFMQHGRQRASPGGSLDSFSSTKPQSKESHLMATHSATGADTRRSGGALSRATRRLATETKQAFKTTEFWAMVALIVAVLIAGNSIESAEGGPDVFAADKVWLYITILGSAYMISRGLAKSGSREPYYPEGTNGDRPDRSEVANSR